MADYIHWQCTTSSAEMIVVFDTNVWKKSLYFKSSASATVKFFLQDQAARVALPEVVRLEVERRLRADITDRCDEIRQRHNDFLGLFDRLQEVVLPKEPEIEALVENFFSGCGFDRKRRLADGLALMD